MREFVKLVRDYVELNEERFELFQHVAKLEVQILEARLLEAQGSEQSRVSALKAFRASQQVRRVRIVKINEKIAHVRGLIVGKASAPLEDELLKSREKSRGEQQKLL